MKHTYHIHGMTCNGCRSHVEATLAKIKGVTNAMVNLEKAEATIEMERHIPIEVFQEVLKNDGGTYSIHNLGEHHHHPKPKKQQRNQGKGTGVFYCPMHCEGDKTYDQPGNCPVCGMDLVEQPALKKKVQYTCPMHPEIIRDKPGSCPICGMDLVPVEADTEEEDKTYKTLLRKFKIDVLFTLPIFVIAMSEMIPGNPLFRIMDLKYWNWVELALSLPVVFYATWMFFQRAWRSIVTWH